MLVSSLLPAEAPTTPHPATPSTPPPPGTLRRELDLAVLLCRLPQPLRALFLPALLHLPGCVPPWGADRRHHPSATSPRQRLDGARLTASPLTGLRALLETELRRSLALTETPLEWLPRPGRNFWLAVQAHRIGEVVGALAQHPEALPLTDELWRIVQAVKEQRSSVSCHAAAVPEPPARCAG